MNHQKQPDKHTTFALVWLIAIGAIFVIYLLYCFVYKGLSALSNKPILILALAIFLVLVIVVKLIERR